MRERQRGVEIGLGRRAVADPRRRDLRVTLDRGGHAPPHRLDELGRQVAADREEAGALVRIHHRQLAALHRIAGVRHQLAHHLGHRDVVARQQQALLAVGRKTHVAIGKREGVRRGDRFFAQALHVKRDLLLALRDQHPGVEDAGLEHRAQPAHQQRRVGLRIPGADGAALVVEHPHQRVGEVAGVGRRHVDVGPAHRAGGRDPKVGKVGLAAGPAGGLGHMQAQGRVGIFGLHWRCSSTLDRVGRRFAGPARHGGWPALPGDATAARGVAAVARETAG